MIPLQGPLPVETEETMNQYDNEKFFEQYGHMARSERGLAGAGEWHELEWMLPDFAGKDVLDLGCGFGWHCKYAADHGARSVLGIDLSEKMLGEAKRRNPAQQITYRIGSIEGYEYPAERYDVVLSSLALHYAEDLSAVFQKIFRTLRPGGDFVFSIEHPIFTAQGPQDWIYGKDGSPLYWPVDHYFTEGERDAVFLGEHVRKYHHTLTTCLRGLLRAGFIITDAAEPEPPENMMDLPGMKDELRRPMMLLISAHKP